MLSAYLGNDVDDDEDADESGSDESTTTAPQGA